MSLLADPRWLAAKAAATAALAVALSSAASVPDALSSAFVALVCVSPSAYAGLRRGLEQLGAAALAGGVTAGVLLVAPRAHPLTAGAALGLTVGACHAVGWGNSYAVAGFTSLYVVLLPFHSLGEALAVRAEAVAVGAAAATAVNVAVAAFASRAIRERRERLARAAVAAPFARAAAACADVALRAEASAAWRPAFEAVEELRADLAAQAREVLLPRRAAVREGAARSLRALHALADVAHLGRHVALLLEGRARSEPALGEALGAVAAWLTEGGEAPVAALERAAEALDEPALAATVAGLARAAAEVGGRAG
ncbi:MAG: aromatic acid exporter family protein [Polyangiales bacterium]